MPIFERSRKQDEWTEQEREFETPYYQFSPKSAMMFWSHGGPWGNDVYFEDAVLHNICLRDIVKRGGVKLLIDYLSTIGPIDGDLKTSVERFVKRWEDVPLGNYDIQVLPIDKSFYLGDVYVSGFNKIRSHIQCVDDWKLKDCAETIFGYKLFVGGLSMSYPKFDSFDYWNDDRMYQNYIIRTRPVTEAEMYSFHKAPMYMDCNAVTERIPEDLLPMVYYRGDGNYMLVAARHGELIWG